MQVQTEIYHNVRHHTASEIYICGKFYIWLVYLVSTGNFYFGVLLPGREIYFLALHLHVQCNICQICNRLEATTTKLYERFVYIHHRIYWIHLYRIWLLRLQDTLGTRVRRSTICRPVFAIFGDKKQFASDIMHAVEMKLSTAFLCRRQIFVVTTWSIRIILLSMNTEQMIIMMSIWWSLVSMYVKVKLLPSV